MPIRLAAQAVPAGILAHSRWPNLVEGINSRIKVIKRMAYGSRDGLYFLLTVPAAFSGNH
ncbi:transposase [Cupriavidus sp. IDO]|uniref:transposase n=1 Tax=Cupriavidus sp. IDO TaxID=1539142 RepID=UPI00057920DC|nr:transposase [Cupriavidus sp. IDO]KWR81088.1 hypothetical protein RM96_29380 [Cupriavidus sp. IDO]